MAKAKPSAKNTPTPDTRQASEGTPNAPDTTQEQAGAGSVLSGVSGPDPVIGLRISAKRDGFRRAGRAWSVQPTEIPLAGLSDADVAALKAEAMLTVEEITLP